MKERTWLHLNIWVVPFVMGAIWEFCPPWIHIPALVVLAMHWIGACVMVNEQKDKKQ